MQQLAVPAQPANLVVARTRSHSMPGSGVGAQLIAQRRVGEGPGEAASATPSKNCSAGMPTTPTPNASWAHGSPSESCGTPTKPSREPPCRRTPSDEPWNPTFREPAPCPPAPSAAPHNGSGAPDRRSVTPRPNAMPTMRGQSAFVNRGKQASSSHGHRHRDLLVQPTSQQFKLSRSPLMAWLPAAPIRRRGRSSPPAGWPESWPTGSTQRPSRGAPRSTRCPLHRGHR